MTLRAACLQRRNAPGHIRPKDASGANDEARRRRFRADRPLCAGLGAEQQQDRANGPPPGTLSDKLDRGEGVIKPPEVDPDIAKQPPRTGNMPVLPPPGEPGGRQDVQPK